MFCWWPLWCLHNKYWLQETFWCLKTSVSMLMLVAPEMQLNHVYSTDSKNIQHGDVGPCPVGVWYRKMEEGAIYNLFATWEGISSPWNSFVCATEWAAAVSHYTVFAGFWMKTDRKFTGLLFMFICTKLCSVFLHVHMFA